MVRDVLGVRKASGLETAPVLNLLIIPPAQARCCDSFGYLAIPSRRLVALQPMGQTAPAVQLPLLG